MTVTALDTYGRESRTSQLDGLLQEICGRLVLSKSQYESARQKYEAVGAWLAAPQSALTASAPRIYPQGSARLGTTVRPIRRMEYDIDLVCEMEPTDVWQRNPMALFNAVRERIEEHKTYRDRLSAHSRCLRISYSGEFHLDVVPAVKADNDSGSAILVPDKDLQEWIVNDPIRYASWFDQQILRRVRKFAELHVQPLPTLNDAELAAPLRQAVQLIKRRRDVVFGQANASPKSIVLTTLAATHYDGSGSVFESLFGVLNKIKAIAGDANGPIEVTNPVNLNENLAARWQIDAETYKNFITFVDDFCAYLARLTSTNGIHEVAKLLSALFSDNLGEVAVRKYSERINTNRTTGALRVSLTSLTLTSSLAGTRSVPRNTFYGD